jgi:hypothetical protein
MMDPARAIPTQPLLTQTHQELSKAALLKF